MVPSYRSFRRGLTEKQRHSKGTNDSITELGKSNSTEVERGSNSRHIQRNTSNNIGELASNNDSVTILDSEGNTSGNFGSNSISLLDAGRDPNLNQTSSHVPRIFRAGSIYSRNSFLFWRLFSAGTLRTWQALTEKSAITVQSDAQIALWGKTDEELYEVFPDYMRSNAMSSWKSLVFKSDTANKLLEQPEQMELYLHKMTKVIPLNADIGSNIFAVIEDNQHGTAHMHLMLRTNKRIDSVKRMIETQMQQSNIGHEFECVKSQSVRHFEGLFKYFLKSPKAILFGNYNIAAAALSCLENTEYQWVDNKENKPAKDVEHILDIMKKYDVYTLEDIMRVCPTEVVHMLSRNNLNTIIANCALFLNVKSEPEDLMRRIKTKATPDYHLRHKISRFLQRQDIDETAFAQDFYTWLWQKHQKRNTFVLQGPSNTGKSSFIRPLLELFRWGQILQAHQFMFQNCICKEIVVWEEPLISKDFADKCKLLFEGSTQMVEIKSRAPQMLTRVPIVITTNSNIWRHCSNEQTAFMNRIFYYEFNVPFSDSASDSDSTGEYSDNSTRTWQGDGNNLEDSTTNRSSKHSSSRDELGSRRDSDAASRRCPFSSSPTTPRTNNGSSPERTTNDNIGDTESFFNSGDHIGTRRSTCENSGSSNLDRCPSNSTTANDHTDDVEFITDATGFSFSDQSTTQCRDGSCPIHGSCTSFDSRTLEHTQSTVPRCTSDLLRAPRKSVPTRGRRHLGTAGRGLKLFRGHNGPSGRPNQPLQQSIGTQTIGRRPTTLEIPQQLEADTERRLGKQANTIDFITKEDWVDWLVYWINHFE